MKKRTKKMLPKKKISSLFFVLFIFLAIPFSVLLALQVTNFFKKASGTLSDIVVDAGSSFDEPNDVWKNLAQGGEEKGRMLGNVISEISKLNPDYIRIDHIYDQYDVVSRNGDNTLSFDWSKLDLTINDILATGAKPFISLSYMPPSITRSDIVDYPKDWGEWQLVVQKTVEHISGKNDRNINGVYYEVWNEPDLFGGFKTYGNKNYLTLYQNASIGASRAANVNFYKFGGPATTSLYGGWTSKFIPFIANNNLKLDFYSWHRYTKNLDDFENDWRDIKRWLEENNMAHVELLITEVGPNSEVDKVYDENFSAIHTIATTAVLQGNIDGMYSFEIKDGPGPEKYWGRWGIITHEKFGTPTVKPRYNALLFLNSMKGNKMNIAGTGSWVKGFAKEDGRVIKLLLVNYDPSGRHMENVPVKFINLPFSSFTFKRTDFNGKTISKTIQNVTKEWSTVETMLPNSASIFELLPL